MQRRRSSLTRGGDKSWSKLHCWSFLRVTTYLWSRPRRTAIVYGSERTYLFLCLKESVTSCGLHALQLHAGVVNWSLFIRYLLRYLIHECQGLPKEVL